MRFPVPLVAGVLLLATCRSARDRDAQARIEEVHGMPAVVVVVTTAVDEDRRIDIEILHGAEVVGGGTGEDGDGELADPEDPPVFEVEALTTVSRYPGGTVFDVVVRYFDATGRLAETRRLRVEKRR